MIMRKFSLPIVIAAITALAALATPANAQATRTWVSGVGNDADPCSRTAPCRTFAGAIVKTAPGGEINCVDPGGFGSVTIKIAITIDCTGVEAGVLDPKSTGIIVDAGANDVVTLRGLDIFGVDNATIGINFIGGRSLHVEDCFIRNFTADEPNGFGILFTAKAAGAHLFVSDTVIMRNGGAKSGGGIRVVTPGSTDALVIFNRIQVYGNGAIGVEADTTGNSAKGVRMVIRESVISTGAGIGVSAKSSDSGVASVFLDRSTSMANTGDGVHAEGKSSFINLAQSMIVANATGISTGSGGSVNSYGNNYVNANFVADGNPSGPLMMK
jgi:hypothetical protein